jgi:hypothetical protein
MEVSAMATREIPPRDWVAFFDRFSKGHQDWPTTIEVVGADVGDQLEAVAHPLIGITVDLKGSENGSIEVMLGSRPEDHAVHAITAPARVWHRQTLEAADEALEIESADGLKMLVLFRAAAMGELPEHSEEGEEETVPAAGWAVME